MRTTSITIPTTIAALAGLLIAGAASPAMADRDGWRGHHGRGHYNHYNHDRPYHYRPPVYYAPPVYRPYYPPPPVYYAPPPTAYYAPPIIGFGITIR